MLICALLVLTTGLSSVTAIVLWDNNRLLGRQLETYRRRLQQQNELLGDAGREAMGTPPSL